MSTRGWKTGGGKWRNVASLGAVLTLLTLATPETQAQNALALDWWTLDGGGGTLSTAQLTLSSTIGQPDAGSLGFAGTLALEGGFWPGTSFAVVAPSTRTWVGPVNGDWFNPANWNPTGVPGSADTIIFDGGSINLAAPVTINGQLNWSGGTLMGNALTIASGGVLNISKSVFLSNALTNAGTVNWQGGALYVYTQQNPNAGPLVNLAGGQWNIQGDNSSVLNTWGSAGANACFVNAGTVRKTDVGTSFVYLPFYNAGEVMAAQGMLNLMNGGPIAGSFQASTSTAGIAFAGGDFIGAGALVSGPGVVQFSGGNLQLDRDAIPNLALTGGTVTLGSQFQGGSITNLTVAGSILSGINKVTGTFNLNGGTLSGPLAVAGGGVLNISKSVFLSNALTNAGTVNWQGGALYVYTQQNPNAGPLVNLAGGQWNIQGDNSSVLNTWGSAGANACFVNAGTVRKTDVGTSYIYLPFYNAGNLNLLSGSLSFNSVNNYTQTEATLHFGIAGSSRPAPLAINGNLGLDGTLSAGLLNNYVPQPGDVIRLISCGTVSNSFASLNLPAVGSGLGWQVFYGANTVWLQAIANNFTTAQITGTVTDRRGAPVANLPVVAYSTNVNNSVFLSTVTDGSGHYALNVTNETWSVGLQGLAARGFSEAPPQRVAVNGVDQVVNFVVEPLPALVLAHEGTGSQLTMSWPVSEPGTVLEATTGLSASTWGPATEEPVIQNGRWVVKIEPSGNARFFRLRKP